MKHTSVFPFLFIILVLTTVFSCRKEHRPNAFIAQLEKTVQTDPEEALRILNHADKNKECPTTADQMVLKLMTIRINDKNLIRHTSDSLINELEKYYKESGTANDLSTVYYYKAAYWRDQGDYLETMDYLLKALNTADTTAIDFNPDIYCSILSQLAYVCHVTYNDKESLQYAKSAFKYKDKIAYGIGLYQVLANMYKANNLDDSAKIYYDIAFELYKKENNWGALRQAQFNTQIDFFIKRKYIESIEERLPYFKKNFTEDVNNHNSYNIALYYELKNNQDSALYYFKRGIRVKDDIFKKYYSFKGLYRIYKDRGELSKAVVYADSAIALRDSISENSESDRILNMSKLYNFNKLKQEKVEGEMKAAGEKAQLLEAIIIVLVILWIFVIAFYFYRKRLKRQISTTSQQLSQTVMIKEEMEERLENIRRRQNDLILALHDCLNKHISPGPKLTRDLENFCQAEFPDVHRIAQEGTKKSAAISVHFYCLREIGFSEQEIATLFGNSRQNVHNICRRLQTKLENATTHLPQAAEEEPTEKIAEDEKTMINGNEG